MSRCKTKFAAEITHAEILEHFSYDPETGELRWRSDWYKGTRTEIASLPNGNGYLRIGFFGRRHYVHRIIFFWMTGSWPVQLIDHINGNRSDNRWENLRQASSSQNGQNCAVRRTNRSGLKGVELMRHGRYAARITNGGNRKYLGSFDTAAEAHAAYMDAAHNLFGDFASAGQVK